MSESNHPLDVQERLEQRRYFLSQAGTGLGAAALASLLQQDAQAGTTDSAGPHFPARAKRIIYLFQSGGPSQLDLYDYKPGLRKRFGEEVPESVYPAERKTTMSSAQASFPRRADKVRVSAVR